MIEKIDFWLMCLFFLCYAYQVVYIVVSLFAKPEKPGKGIPHRIAVLIAARNESAVLGNLLQSIHEQDYPKDLLDVFVVADNCTDNTAAIAAENHAYVYERHSTTHVGKGYALNFLLTQMDKEGKQYDAYLVLDADNLLSCDFVTEINRTFSSGYKIVTSYRNSKNFSDNWISAGYGLWFLREARYLNHARMKLGVSCAVSGTGFMFSREVLEECGGWHYYLLTEDIEFTVDNIIRGNKIGYSSRAVLYDEQPTSFAQSWRQRMRWSRGNMQVTWHYFRRLASGMLHGSFSCFDIAMSVCPGVFLAALGIIANLADAVYNLVNRGSFRALAVSLLMMTLNLYLTFFVAGVITTITEWKNIHCSPLKKLLYCFTFPIFMFTYLPIGVAAVFKNPQWKPIAHTRNLALHQIGEQKQLKAKKGK